MFADHDGLCIGSGPKYGIFIERELLKGFSTPCETFENITLSSATDFEIKNIEVKLIIIIIEN